MNKVIVALLVVALLVGGVVYYVLQKNNTSDYDAETGAETDSFAEVVPTQETEPIDDEIEAAEPARGPESVIGQSEEGTDIVAYHYGDGDEEVLLIGGIHGAYSANTSVLMTELMDDLEGGDVTVPDEYTVTVIPVLNPDGLEAVFGTTDIADITISSQTNAARTPGRFNANDVDLNRNFDCEWETEGVWQSRAVSGGTEPFSEAESQAVREYVNSNNIAAAVVYYSAEGAVYASQCNKGTLPATTEMTAVYASASGYAGKAEFDFYAVTGDMVNWLAKNNIPAISVLLTDHVAPETAKNRAGVEAVLNYLAE